MPLNAYVYTHTTVIGVSNNNYNNNNNNNNAFITMFAITTTGLTAAYQRH